MNLKYVYIIDTVTGTKAYTLVGLKGFLAGLVANEHNTFSSVDYDKATTELRQARKQEFNYHVSYSDKNKYTHMVHNITKMELNT